MLFSPFFLLMSLVDRGPDVLDIGRYLHIEKRSRVNRRCYIRDVESIPKATVTNMVVSAGVFERWLSQRERNQDARNCFEIPPEQLDCYLSDFYLSVKTPHGHDYKPRSLECIRWSLDRYLKSTGYSSSIVSSKVFANSQRAFKLRIKELHAKMQNSSST